MGIYTSNRYFGEAFDYASEIPANEAYDAAFGCAHIFADNQKNDMALFESAIYEDIKEVTAIHEGYGYVNENAFTNMIKKMIETFKKILAKIKGIFKAFIAKITGAFTNGKNLVKQYELPISKCSNWKGFKVNGIRKPSSGNENIKSSIDNLFTMKISCKYELNHKATNEDSILDTGIDKIKTVKDIKEADAEDIKLAILNKAYLGGNFDISEWKEISTEILNHLYDEEGTISAEDESNFDSSFFSKSWIKSVLADDKWVEGVKKVNDKMDKVINQIINDLKKTEDALADWKVKNDDNKRISSADIRGGFASGEIVTKDTKVNSKAKTNFNSVTNGIKAEVVQAGVHALQTLASNEQEVITKVTSEYMSNVKFAIAQARKLWTAAAAWSSSVHKESVEYYQALGEAEAEQFYTSMESL